MGPWVHSWFETMAACAPQPGESTDPDPPPGGWEPLPPDECNPSEYSAWEHRITGLRVAVAQSRKPDQMMHPRTSRDQIGYVARVRDANYGGNLSRPLAQRSEAFDAAARFMRTYPNGEFSVPHPTTRPASEPVEWEGR